MTKDCQSAHKLFDRIGQLMYFVCVIAIIDIMIDGFFMKICVVSQNFLI